MENAMSSR